MLFIGFFSIVYLLYNLAIFIIDALLYASVWQSNLLCNRLRQHHLLKQPDVGTVMIDSDNEQRTSIDKSFSDRLTDWFDRRSLRLFDSSFVGCRSWRQSLFSSPPVKKNRDRYILPLSDETTTIRAVVNALPALVKCTFERL